MKHYLVTTALPYANGSIHLGHVLEAIQTDIWVRFQNANGNSAYFFCADDTHGTPVMLAASKRGITPEQLVGEVLEQHKKDLSGFHVHYDNFYTTNSPENKHYSELIYNRLKSKGHIHAKEIEQSYCEHDKMFLPDRFIKGTCPNCGALDQYGDSCEVCGATYSPKDLKKSYCAICKNTPVLKFSKHLFFKLEDFTEFLKTWVETPGRLQEGAKRKLGEWFEKGLHDWDISRDAPYFGFEIPGEKEKFFYVWLDAPIGYMASSANHLQNRMEDWKQFWESKDNNHEIHHFVGKDILYFHGLFWPAMLSGSDFTPPTKLHVHGFITVNGEKMSKSRGTFINASTYLKYLDPEHLRFYLGARLTDGMEDLDLHFEDFANRVNSDLVGNLVNIVSRVSTSLLDKYNRKTSVLSSEGKKLHAEILAKKSEILQAYESKNTAKAIREITSLGDQVNKYINDLAPWSLFKTDPEKAQRVITDGLQCAKELFLYLLPVLPNSSGNVLQMLGVDAKEGFSNLGKSIEQREILPFSHVTTRVDTKKIEEMLSENKKEFMTNQEENSNRDSLVSSTDSKKQAQDAQKPSEGAGLISITDLQKVELRVGKILRATAVEGADKLLQITLSLGEFGEKNVFAGIKSSYKPEDLEGLHVVTVSNLEPRKMKFGISEAMLLASGTGENLSLFVPHRTAKPGDLLK